MYVCTYIYIYIYIYIYHSRVQQPAAVQARSLSQTRPDGTANATACNMSTRVQQPRQGSGHSALRSKPRPRQAG